MTTILLVLAYTRYGLIGGAKATTTVDRLAPIYKTWQASAAQNFRVAFRTRPYPLDNGRRGAAACNSSSRAGEGPFAQKNESKWIEEKQGMEQTRGNKKQNYKLEAKKHAGKWIQQGKQNKERWIKNVVAAGRIAFGGWGSPRWRRNGLQMQRAVPWAFFLFTCHLVMVMDQTLQNIGKLEGRECTPKVSAEWADIFLVTNASSTMCRCMTCSTLKRRDASALARRIERFARPGTRRKTLSTSPRRCSLFGHLLYPLSKS